MKKIFILALAVMLTGLFTISYAFDAGIYSEPSKLISIDKEDDFKRASTSRGCKSIPYTSLQRDCQRIHDKQKEACDNYSCKGFDSDMQRAIRDDDQREMDRLRREGGSRQIKAMECTKLRKAIMVIFKKVKSQVTQEKRTFESNLRSEKAPGKIEYYEDMIEYSKKIIQEMDNSEGHHGDEVNEAGRVHKECKRFNDKYN